MASIAEDQRAGIPVKRMEYPSGTAGLKHTLNDMAQKIREGSRTPSMRSFAGNVLKKAGFPASTRARGQALLDYLRSAATYAPDPAMTEMVVSAPITLCVDGAPMCMPIFDCDDGSVALASMMGAAGMEVKILMQHYGGDHQDHVLVLFKDDDGSWLAADPSVKDLPVGQKLPAKKEVIVDPLDAASIGLSGASEGEFIGVGRASGGGGHGGGSRGGGSRGGGSLGGGSRGGGGRTSLPRGSWGGRRWSGGQWWGWNGSGWYVDISGGCTQWANPLSNPSADLLSQARAHLAASGGESIADVWNGVWYLYSADGTIRPCSSAVIGYGAPRIGMGALIGVGDINDLAAQIDGQITSMNTSVQACTNFGDASAWTGFYNGWQALKTSWSATSTALASAGVVTLFMPADAALAIGEYLQAVDEYNQMRALLDKPDGTPGPITGWQKLIASKCSGYTAPPSIPAAQAPSITPDLPGGGTVAQKVADWADQVTGAAKAVGALIGVGVGGYIIYKVVQVAGEYAGKKKR